MAPLRALALLSLVLALFAPQGKMKKRMDDDDDDDG